MKKSKRIFAVLLVAIMLIIPMDVAAASEEQLYLEYIVTNSNARVNATISDVDFLLEQREMAFIEGDHVAYDAITASLRSMGLREISIEEIAALTGEDFDTMPRIMARSNVRRETINSTVFSGGNRYEVMRIIVTPTGVGTLHTTGVTTQNNRNSAAANAVEFARIAVTSIAGTASNTIGIVQTVHGALRDIVSVVQPNTTITNISASYTWSVTERAVFIYIFDNDLGSYRLSARFHSATAAVGVSVPTLVINGNQSTAVVRQWSHSGAATPTDYNNVFRAVEAFRQRGSFTLPVFSSSIRSVNFTGIEGQVVRTQALINHSTPLETGT